MSRFKNVLITALFAGMVSLALFVITPQKTEAFSWGGQFTSVIPCMGGNIWVSVSAPRGGAFIWTPITKTFQYGPPRHAGQYGLGLAGPPTFCLVSPFPVIPIPGIIMLMLGTSQ